MIKVWRIRKYCGKAGGSNYYYHADVIAPHWQTALKAANDERVKNWRWIDTYDSTDEDYCYYEYLYQVSDNPRKPATPMEI